MRFECSETSVQIYLNKASCGYFKLADLVKFAKVIPGTEENALQLDEAVKFVKIQCFAKNRMNRC